MCYEFYMPVTQTVAIAKSWLKFFNTLNESQRRWAAAVKAAEIGYGGISQLARSTGLSRTTITQGIRELKKKKLTAKSSHVRSKGGGRKPITENNKAIKTDLEKILSETSAGDPMSSLRWTCKSSRTMAKDLCNQGHSISYRTVNRLLHDLDYSLQSNRKTLSRDTDPNRDDQFRNINSTVKAFFKQDQPVISVDTKKREQVGKFKNQGRTWRRKKSPELVEDHDYLSRAEGVAIPYGTFDIHRNEGFVNVGVTKDTAEFAVNSIKQWWNHFGRKHYPKAKKLLICADGGGSNGSSSRLWKLSLQKLAQQIGLSITVCHYPPGTSKWNKIEHRMFSYISINWRGRPLKDYETVINLISNTTTRKGLKIKAKLDKRTYKTGKKVSKEDFEAINIKFHTKYPKWNYTIKPT